MSVEQVMGSSVLIKIFKIVETKKSPNSNKGIWGILLYYQSPLAPPPEKSPPPPKPLKESELSDEVSLV